VKLPREALVGIGAALVLGLLSWRDVADAYQRTRAPAPTRTAPAELARPPEVLLHPASAAPGERDRPAFAPPRELLPLDALDLPLPPLPPLSIVRPAFSPAPVGSAARAERVPASSLGRLQLTPDAGASDAAGGDGGLSASPTSPGGNPTPSPAGTAPGGKGGGATPAGSGADASASAASLYDWVVRTGSVNRHFGRIHNDDPHGLAQRLGEAIRFQDVSLRNGAPVGAPYTIPRDEVSEFGLALTFENRYLAASRALGTGVGAADERMDLVQQMLQAHPMEPRALEFATREAQLAVAAGGRDAAPRRLLARVLAKTQDLEGELAVYQDSMADGVLDAALLADYARFLLRLGLSERAAVILEQARGQRLASAEVRLTRGLLLQAEGRWEEALTAFREAEQVGFQPPFAERQRDELLLLTGRAELALGRADEALRLARRVLLANPADSGALQLQGAAQAALGDLESAAEAFRTALVSDPTNGELLTNAALVAWARGDGPSAVRLAEQARDVDPYRALAPTVVLGFLHEDAGELERAADYYTEALVGEPGQPQALYHLGRILRLAGDPEQAGQQLRLALRLGGPHVLLLCELGRAARDSGDPAVAARYFREALRLEPGNAEVLANLGLAYLEAGDLVSTLEVLQQAVAAGDGASHAGLGVAHYRRGDQQVALEHFDEVQRAFAGRADEPPALYAAAQAAAIRDNLAKRQWVDRFSRSTLQHGWDEHQWEGSPRLLLDGQALHISGEMRQTRTDEHAGVSRSLDGKGFVSATAELTALAGSSRYGIALTYRQLRGGSGRQPKTRLELWVDSDGVLRHSVLENYDSLLVDAQPLAGISVPPGTPVRLGIERLDASKGSFRFLVDGRPVGETLELKSMRNFTNAFDLELYGEAPPGRQCDVVLSLVRIVRFP